MRKIIFVAVIIVLSGCRATVTVSEMNVDRVKGDLQSFVEAVGQENGNYLYVDNEGDLYIFLNQIHVSKGSDALYFRNFYVTKQKNVVTIHFTQESDSDYESTVNYQAFYKIKLNSPYEEIRLIGDGRPIAFDEVHHN